MALPLNPFRFSAAMDPGDRIDYLIGLSGMLEAGEAVASITASVLAESALLGFQLEPAGGYSPSQPTPLQLLIWVSIATASQGNSTWSGEGQDCGVDITIVTNSTPARRLSRTVIIKVQQQ